MRRRAPATGDHPGAPPRVAVTIVAFAAGLNAIVPLFPAYAERFDLSTGDLTLAFSVYALVLLPSLLLLGDLSDRIGRKRVLVPALLMGLGASALLASAKGLGWLVAGRALQGLGGGLFWGTIAAYARDLHSDAHRDRAALLVTVSFTGGLAVGALGAGAITHITGSIVLPWLVHVVTLAVALPVLLGGPETVRASGQVRITLTLSIPSADRSGFLWFLVPVTFVLVATSVVVLNLLPLMVSSLAPSAATAVAGVGVALELTLATVAQVVTRHLPAYRLTIVGSVVMLSGASLLPLALAVQQIALLFVGVAAVGVATGLVFRSTMALAERMAQPHERAAVMSAYNVLLYGGLSVPALTAGRLADRMGEQATLVLVIGIALIAAVFAFTAGRRRLGAALRAHA